MESGDDMSDGPAAAVLGGVGCVLLVALVGWAAIAYNLLARLRDQADTSWAQIDVQLKRRHDLIPRLVGTVEAYAAYERGALDAVVTARGRATSAALGGRPAGRSAAESALTQALGRLFAATDAYPQLQADPDFAALRSELTIADDKITQARRSYNGTVRSFNSAVRKLPTNLIAGVVGFRARDFFEAPDGERDPARVRF